MTRDEAVAELSGLLDGLRRFRETGGAGAWKSEWDRLENDVDEFMETTFGTNSKDYREVNAALNPRWVSVGTNEWKNLVKNYVDPVMRALLLVRHRLEKGHARLVDAARETHLIDARTPHSAYVFLRDIIEAASQSILVADPYVDRSVFPLLSNVKPSVAVRILTRQQNLPSDFAEELHRFQQQKGMRIEARCGLQDFHDRLLAVDGRLFLSGASFKDLGKKGSFVTELSDIRAEALKQVEERWDSAGPV